MSRWLNSGGCINDDSDGDVKKCVKLGYISDCPNPCEFYTNCFGQHDQVPDALAPGRLV